MIKIDPQKYLEDFKEGVFVKENNQLLAPIYEKLFQEFADKINITKECEKDVKKILKYFEYLKKIKKYHGISFSNKTQNKKKIVEEFAKSINPKYLQTIVKSVNRIVKFLSKNRKNINGLQILCWTFFRKTTLEDVKRDYLNNEKAISAALKSFDFLSLFIESDNFAKIAFGDLLIDLEIKNPSRRKGNFDKLLFEIIFNGMRRVVPAIEYNIKDNLKKKSLWLIDERMTKKINFPLSSKNSKFVDLVCKVGKCLLIGSHKEQNETGGAQDNQAKDAKEIFNYSSKNLENVKNTFNVNVVYLCVILQAEIKKVDSKHWKPIFKIVNNKRNKNKYLLNGFQFIKLVNDIYKNSNLSR